MSLQDVLHVYACLLLKIVDVLCHILPHNAFVLQQLCEVMGWRRLKLGQVEVLCELVKRLWLVQEVI